MSEARKTTKRRGEVSYGERLSWLVDRVEQAARSVATYPMSLTYVRALAGRLKELDEHRRREPRNLGRQRKYVRVRGNWRELA